MFRHKLFQGSFYYPSGGYQDFIGKFISYEEAIKSLDTTKDWYQLVRNDQIVESGVILRGDDALGLKQRNKELVMNELCNSGYGETVLTAWYTEEDTQIAILKEIE